MGRVLCGTSSWNDRSMTHDSTWYPKRSMKAAERMAFYAARLPLVEIDATERFPPTPDLSRQWAERTPAGFRIDLQGWSLLTGGATLPDSLWEDLRDEVRPELRDRRRLYAGHLSRDGIVEAWDRFHHAVLPLHEAGRLGAIVMRYPHWLKPGDTGRTLLVQARHRLAGLPIAVELRNPHWLDDDECEDTLAFLDDHDLAFVAVDGRRDKPVVASTSDLGVVRLLGRGEPDWETPDIAMGQRFAHRYDDDELREWVPRVRELATACSEVHVLFSNVWRDDHVVNAERFAELLGD